MAGSLNQVHLIGHLGADPELRYTQNQTPVVQFSVATTETWKDKEGVKQEKTEWHRVVAWQQLAELCSKYLAKGRQVHVQGRLQTRSWEDDKGVKRYSTEIIADQVIFLGKGGEHRNDAPLPDEPARTQQQARAQPAQQQAAPQNVGAHPGIDEIPF